LKITRKFHASFLRRVAILRESLMGVNQAGGETFEVGAVISARDPRRFQTRLTRLWFQQPVIAVLAPIQEIEFTRLGVHEQKEGMSQQFHLLDGSLRAHGE